MTRTVSRHVTGAETQEWSPSGRRSNDGVDARKIRLNSSRGRTCRGLGVKRSAPESKPRPQRSMALLYRSGFQTGRFRRKRNGSPDGGRARPCGSGWFSGKTDSLNVYLRGIPPAETNKSRYSGYADRRGGRPRLLVATACGKRTLMYPATAGEKRRGAILGACGDTAGSTPARNPGAVRHKSKAVSGAIQSRSGSSAIWRSNRCGAV